MTNDGSFSLYKSAKAWFHSQVEPQEVDSYYHDRVLKPNKFPLVAKIASSLYDPKIFDVMKPAKAARYAAIDGWIRMMWHGQELPRWVREALAVAVSTSNACEY